MYHKLHKHLTFLYTITTGLLLTCLLSICCFYMYSLVQSKNEAAFSSHFLNISTKFQTENSFSDAWLSQMESSNRLIIQISENGLPLFFKGSWSPQTPREELLARAQALAQEYSIYTESVPVSSSSIQSPLFTFQGEHHDWYTAMLLVCRTEQGQKSLILLQDITASRMQFFEQAAFFLVLDFAGVFLLGLISWVFVGKSIQPLKENQQKQTAFLAAASHELRTPVAVIQASVQAVPASPEHAPSLLHTIERECRRMSRLISDLLFLASADNNHYKVANTPQDADTILLDAFEMFDPLFRRKNIRLRLHLPAEETPPVCCDRDRMIQVLSILLDNAMSYAPEGSEVSLISVWKDGMFSFSVADHGPGIPDEEKEMVFDRFYRADASRKSDSHFGLGLSVAMELVHLQGGKLRLEDTKGGGATFTVTVKAPVPS